MPYAFILSIFLAGCSFTGEAPLPTQKQQEKPYVNGIGFGYPTTFIEEPRQNGQDWIKLTLGVLGLVGISIVKVFFLDDSSVSKKSENTEKKVSPEVPNLKSNLTTQVTQARVQTPNPKPRINNKAMQKQPKKYDYLIYTRPLSGTGDISLAYKTAKAILDKDPKTKIGVLIGLEASSYSPGYDPTQSVPKGVFLINEGRPIEPQDAPKADKVITLTRDPFFRNKENDLYLLREYNASGENPKECPKWFKACICSGFGEGYRGIYWLSEQEIESARQTTLSISNPKMLPLAYQTFLNIYLSGDYYFGYFATYLQGKTRAKFINKMAQKNNDGSIHVVLPGYLKGKGSTPDQISTYYMQHFNDNTVRDITYIDIGRQSWDTFGIERKVINAKAARSIYVYYGALSHATFLNLMARSKYPEVGVTGDQSLGEALSLGKYVYYESLTHKEGLFDALVRLGVPAEEWEVAKVEHVSYLKSHSHNFSNLFNQYPSILEKLRQEYDLAQNLTKIIGME